MPSRRSLDYIEKRFDEFLDNHWPTMERRIGRLEGQVYVLLGIGGITIAGIITVLLKAW
jgi:hypothetical protein